MVRTAMFTEMPTPWNATLGDGKVTFQCQPRNADSVTWRLNGSFLSQLNPVTVPGILANMVPNGTDFLYTLCIPATAEYNNTVVECVAFIHGQSSSFSDRVELRVQG